VEEIPEENVHVINLTYVSFSKLMDKKVIEKNGHLIRPDIPKSIEDKT